MLESKPSDANSAISLAANRAKSDLVVNGDVLALASTENRMPNVASSCSSSVCGGPGLSD